MTVVHAFILDYCNVPSLGVNEVVHSVLAPPCGQGGIAALSPLGCLLWTVALPLGVTWLSSQVTLKSCPFWDSQLTKIRRIDINILNSQVKVGNGSLSRCISIGSSLSSGRGHQAAVSWGTPAFGHHSLQVLSTEGLLAFLVNHQLEGALPLKLLPPRLRAGLHYTGRSS